MTEAVHLTEVELEKVLEDAQNAVKGIEQQEGESVLVYRERLERVFEAEHADAKARVLAARHRRTS